ncbi:hypothetical protein Vadar_005368 [Vaccinium darrowii]|uniref:Uncharacterized protein n=1 Tax=Vaccinium darrowii TaxID=229202 RepID=A0ACB7YU62_9ERIC|nr:hypothetical protein Vadar_005368 [Vaccinium darrowii]
MDYKKVANSGLKFRQLYGGFQDVVVPEMYVENTTCRVLTMQWVEASSTNYRQGCYKGVFQDVVAKGVRNISFGDLLGNLGTTMFIPVEDPSSNLLVLDVVF